MFEPSYKDLRAPLVAQTVKNLSSMQETQAQSLGREDPLEKGMAPHSSILAWRIPWTEESGRLQSPWGSQKELDTIWQLNNKSKNYTWISKKREKKIIGGRTGCLLFLTYKWTEVRKGVRYEIKMLEYISRRHLLKWIYSLIPQDQQTSSRYHLQRHEG